MTNLLSETQEAISESGHVTSDVAYVGTVDGSYQITWRDFESIADVVYDSGYGSPEVATDLVVRFRDDTLLIRGEYDGSEWWDYQGRPPETKQAGLPFTKVVGGMWDTLSDLNKEEKTMSDNPHRVKVTLSQLYGVGVDIVCDAPEGASCRVWCDDGCEFGSPEHWANHTILDQGYCTQTEGWFDVEPLDLYVGPDTELRSGPIDLIWDGDYFTWRYADDETGDNDE